MGHQDSAPVYNDDIKYQTHVKIIGNHPNSQSEPMWMLSQLGEPDRLVEASVTHQVPQLVITRYCYRFPCDLWLLQEAVYLACFQKFKSTELDWHNGTEISLVVRLTSLS
jgi:hypothetical protein